ncbi:MAG: hypothetical protein CL398_05545 [Acidiferrobacteraceae bacterium]|nr:hypothetical protein [Acidiferrobacteraceae bacterium]
MDKKLLDILRCPVTKQQMFILSEQQLCLINDAIANDRLIYADGSKVNEPLEEALITENRKRVYRVETGIPVMLEDESIATEQIDNFY